MNSPRNLNDNDRTPAETPMEAPRFPYPLENEFPRRTAIYPSRRALVEIMRGEALSISTASGPQDDDAPSQTDAIGVETARRYLDRCQNLIRRYRRESGILRYDASSDDGFFDGLDAHAFAIWLVSLKPDLSKSTWRYYRRASYFTISHLPTEGVEAALLLLDADRALQRSRAGRDDIATSDTTVRKKAAFFDRDDFEFILQSLQYRAARTDIPLVLRDWLVAGINVGLRPLEWRATAVESVVNPETGKRMLWLFVLDPKTTNLSGSGLMRTIDISCLSHHAGEAVYRMSERGRAWHLRGVFGDEHGKFAKDLSALSRNLYPRRSIHYSLYSCRHQFIANMTRHFSTAELAALAGLNGYGHRQSGSPALNHVWPQELVAQHPRPIASDVATAQTIFDLGLERQKFTARRRQICRDR